VFFSRLVRAGLLAAVAALALSSSTLFAQGAGDQRTRDTLAAVVVTATGVPVSTVAPTASATVLRGDDLRAAGITRVLDALRMVPGAMIVASGPIGSQTSLFLRGGNSNYVRVLIDGVPVNDDGGAYDFSSLTTDNIDRIEIVRGPSSVLHGSDAVTGVIQVFTRDGHGPVATHALVGAGSDGARRGELGFTGGDAGAGFSLLGAHESTNGILAFNNGFDNDVLSGALRLTPDAQTDARLSARWTSATYHFPTDYTGAVMYHNQNQTDHRLVLSLDAGHRFTDRVELRGGLQSDDHLPVSNMGPNTPADTLGYYGYYSRGNETHRAGDVRMNLRYGERGTFTVGAEVAQDHDTSSSLSLSQYGNSNGAFEASRRNSALIAEAVGDVSTRFSYSLGGRIDQNSAFGTFHTLRAAAGYALGDNLRIRGALGNAFVAPSFDENFSTGFVTGNPNLRPEQSRSAELGTDAYLANGALTLKLTGFRQHFINVIQYTGTAPAPNAPNYFNVAAADANGVELAAEYHVLRLFTVVGAYTYLDTRATKAGFDSTTGADYVAGQPLIRRPRNSGSLSFIQTLSGGGSLSLATTYVGERADRDFVPFPAAPVTLPAYTKVDFAVMLPVWAQGQNDVALVGRVDNLFNAMYQEIDRFAAPGRLVFVGVRVGR
jgi:vitamin B12 transporter